MRPIAVLTAAMTAVLVAGTASTALAGEPAEVRWQNRIAGQAAFSEADDVAVSPDGATAYVIGSIRGTTGDLYDTPYVHAVDVATGATRWTTNLEKGLNLVQVTVNPSTGEVVTGGGRFLNGKDETVVTALSPTGEQAWTSAVTGRQFWDMAIDPTYGHICVVTATGSGSIWTTQCFSSSGQGRFAKDFRSRSNSWPNAIAIDEGTHRIFVAGDRSVKGRSMMTSLAYNAQGRDLWQRSVTVNEDYPDVQDVAIDSKTKRLYVLLDNDRRAMVIAQRTTNGTTAFARSYGSGKSKTPRPQSIDVLPRSHRVVVTSHAKPSYQGSLRYLDKRGKQLAITNFRECCDVVGPTIDPATDRISLAWGPGTFDDGVPLKDEGVGAATWDRRGTKVSDLDISTVGQVRAIAGVASAGEDLLVLGDRPYSSTGEQTGSFLVAVR